MQHINKDNNKINDSNRINDNIFRDIDNSDEILSNEMNSPFNKPDKEINLKLRPTTSLKNLELSICKNKPCKDINFSNSMDRLNTDLKLGNRY